MQDEAQTAKYALMGRIAMRPGIVHSIELLQRWLAETDQMIEAARTPAGPGRREPIKKRVKVEVDQEVALAKSGWPADPEERRAEMKRRMAVRNVKKMKARLSRAAKKRWAAKSPAERRAHMAKMAAGRQGKTPVVKLLREA